MSGIWRRVHASLTIFWQGLRAWSGDSAYETYARCAAREGKTAPLSPEQFYVEQLNRKYSRPNRCC